MQKPCKTLKPVVAVDPPRPLKPTGDWFAARVVDGIGHVSIFGEIGPTDDCRDLLLSLRGCNDIRLSLNSRGGDSNGGLNLFYELSGRLKEVTISEKCYSAAVTIALAGKKIRMERDAKMLIHAPCSWAYAPADQMAAIAKNLKRVTECIHSIITTRCELPKVLVTEWLSGRDVYFTSEQALEYGLIDEIFDAPAADNYDAPAAPLPSGESVDVIPQFTEDERFFLDMLKAVGRLQVNNRQAFIREVCTSLFYSTDETPKKL